ncbi:ATP phosphoribosyltransferase [bacterium]|nr:ATP phosphoribosyltransferase [bacterium]
MQDSSRSSTSRILPRWGEALVRLRAWESDFRDLAGQRGFTELNLPLSLPSAEFLSCISGESVLPAAPKFLDSNATEWSLRSDLTLFSAHFVCRQSSELSFPFRLFYSGKVFSPQGLLGADGFRLGHASEFESYEFGAEIVGEKSLAAEKELLELALSALRRFGYSGLRVVIGDTRLVKRLEETLLAQVDDQRLRSHFRNEMRAAIHSKDLAQIEGFLRQLEKNQDCNLHDWNEFQELSRSVVQLRQLYPDVVFEIDPLLTRQRNFYSGLVFDFWATDSDGRLQSVGGGGRYDALLEHFGKPYSAAGFMIRDPQTTGLLDERVNSKDFSSPSRGETRTSRRPIRVALPKGRLQKFGAQAFSAVGIQISENPDTTRKLVLLSECGAYEFLLVKNADAISYVERGIADLAIAGSDLLEEENHSVLRPVTFAFGRCRICLAGKPEARELLQSRRKARIATKYPNLALRLLRAQGINPELVPLQGSVELASVISFCDAIVDLVETGSTLRENGLVVLSELTSTRVQLVTSRGFFAEARDSIRHWLHQWSQHGMVIDAHFKFFADEEYKHDSSFHQ